MAETSDYDPGGWTGYDFKAAKSSYDKHVGRSYDDAVTAGKTAAELAPDTITTDSSAPLVILCDVTGSMGDWPATIFSKLPYLDKEGQEYLGPDMAICFGAIGDANSDKYPLQMQPFVSGPEEMPSALQKLVIEGNGGGQSCESYEIAALYASRNITAPKAIRKPILILIGDEGAYEFVPKDKARQHARVTLKKDRIDTTEIFKELREKFAVYIIRKPYGNGEAGIQKQWTDLLGEDHVCSLPSADRVVDVIFGILAQETNRVPYFKKEIEGRQKPEQVAVAYKSLKTIHKLAVEADKKSGKSVMHIPGGKKTKSLLP